MFFKRLEDLRIDHDLTQQEVADILHCQREVYRRYEKGTRQIPVDSLITLAKYYHCSTDYILGLTNQRQAFQTHSRFRQQKNQQKKPGPR